MGMVGNNMTTGIRTTDFYPPNFSIAGSMDWASQNASIGQATGANNDNHAGASGIAGGAWLIGLIIALVLLRVAYEYA